MISLWMITALRRQPRAAWLRKSVAPPPGKSGRSVQWRRYLEKIEPTTATSNGGTPWVWQADWNRSSSSFTFIGREPVAKKSSTSSRPEKLVRVKAEHIFNKPLTGPQRAALSRLPRKTGAEIEFSDIPPLTDGQLAQMVPFRLRSITTSRTPDLFELQRSRRAVTTTAPSCLQTNNPVGTEKHSASLPACCLLISRLLRSTSLTPLEDPKAGTKSRSLSPRSSIRHWSAANGSAWPRRGTDAASSLPYAILSITLTTLTGSCWQNVHSPP